MKKRFTFVVLLYLIFNISVSTYSQDSKYFNENRANTVASLLAGLESDNTGLKSGSAYMLGELKVTSAVIPLMRVLHNDDNTEVRIAAALALYKIGTPLSINAVKKASRFDESVRVKKLTQNFYANFVRNQNNEKNRATNYFAQSE